MDNLTFILLILFVFYIVKLKKCLHSWYEYRNQNMKNAIVNQANYIPYKTRHGVQY
jgi:hypothetical protein